jgi:hypothetical protein
VAVDFVLANVVSGLHVIGVDYQPAAFDISSPIGICVLRVSHGPARSTSVSAHDPWDRFSTSRCT